MRPLSTAVFALITALAGFAASGCIDMNHADACTSDGQCRFGRVCNLLTGECVDPSHSQRPVAERPDGGAAP